MDETEQYIEAQVFAPVNDVKTEPVELQEDSDSSGDQDIKYSLSEFENDFSSLKKVVYKLERISDKLGLAATADQYEHFGNYLATLLRGIPQKDFLSLKQKFISDVIRVKTALDESNHFDPLTTVSETEDPLECTSVDINAYQDNTYHHDSSERIHTGSDASDQRDIPVCKNSTNSGPPKALVVTTIPAITSPTVYRPILPKINENSSVSGNSIIVQTRNLKRPSKSVISRKLMKKPHIVQTEKVQAEQELSAEGPLSQVCEVDSLSAEGPLSQVCEVDFLSAEEPLSQVCEVDSLSFTEDSCEVEIEAQDGRDLLDFKSEMLGTCTSNSSKTEHSEINSQAERLLQSSEKEEIAQLSLENVHETVKEASNSKRDSALTDQLNAIERNVLQNKVDLTTILELLQCQHQDNVTVPNEFEKKFPMKELDDVLELENALSNNEDKAKELTNYLRLVGGVSMEDSTRRILIRLFTNEVARHFSWEGRGGKKRSLQN